jgi:glycosyltransferase involved in cell wall biosynthesis
MKKQKILYIANGNSIHDVKWMSFFSTQNERYTCFLLCDTMCELNAQTKSTLAELNIHLVEQISPLSIKRLLRSWRAIRQFKKMVQDIKPDVIHVLFATPNALWLNFTNTPSIITTRGSDILRVIPELKAQHGIKKPYFMYLFFRFKKAFKKAQFCTGTSQLQVRSMKTTFSLPEPILIRTGVDVKKIIGSDYKLYLPKKLQGIPYVISPRFMSPIYRIDMQLDAIEKLSDHTIKDLTFVFIRGVQYDAAYYATQLKRLESLKKEKGIKSIVLEYLSQDEIVAVLKHAHLCVMTPQSDGTPNSALEAMAASCPLIVPNLPYDDDLFLGTCLMLNENTAESLAIAIETAIHNYPERLIIHASKQVLANGDRTNEMQKLTDLYDSMD